MKKLSLLIVFVIAFMAAGALFSHAGLERAKQAGDPWKALKKQPAIKQIKLKRIGRRGFDVFLGDIRRVLEKAKINEPVRIHLKDAKGHTLCLGTFAPALRKPAAATKISRVLFNPQPEPPKFRGTPAHIVKKKSAAASKISRVLINPQPEPPRFRGMPSHVKAMSKGSRDFCAVKTDSTARKLKRIRIPGRLIIRAVKSGKTIIKPVSLDMLNTEPIL